MMKVFLDTNIILDYFLAREEHLHDAEAILTMGYNGECELYISSLSFSNIAYISRKKFSGSRLYHLLNAIRELVHCAPVDECIVDNAIQIQAKDFEDALQFFSAKGIHADYIITRNKKDFTLATDINVISPKDFLTKVRFK